MNYERSPLVQKVSTRAPAKGATTDNKGGYTVPKVSTRAPAKGATNLKRWGLMPVIQFQLALPRRERQYWFISCWFSGVVSTRAPAKGATQQIFDSLLLLIVSTRAPAKGATL